MVTAKITNIQIFILKKNPGTSTYSPRIWVKFFLLKTIVGKQKQDPGYQWLKTDFKRIYFLA